MPVERIRLDKEVVTETETVSEQVRKEQIELDAPESATVRGQGTPGRRDTV